MLAGPGTGKTHALVDLYEQAVREGIAGRDQILVLTFSTGAAGEIALFLALLLSAIGPLTAWAGSRRRAPA